ncbi:uncharacterized protein LOC141690616 [Apium graveolens]|uniref:uncharacterized protein LOC141690616 n=1 Tax=Apium graveolens TaxID=4045 RepID=UPI003D7B7833
MDINIGLGLGDEFDAMIHNAYGTNDVTDHVGRIGLNDDASKFYRLVKEGGQPLYPECKKFSRLSFLVRLCQLKCIHGFSESGFSDLLELIKEVFPHVNLPSSFSAAKGMIKDLGLDYQKIHACPNNCMLFWPENERLENCAKYGTSRWRVVEKKAKARSDANIELASNSKIPAKVMRYFPLKTRLQRMFLSSDFSSSMTWHALSRKKDGRLRHPADEKGWKSMDSKYPKFAAEMRNVRLGLAVDDFNPYGSMNISHSTWPLKELWAVGIETYDARLDNTFKLHTSLLWMISDFPGYGILSDHKWRSDRRRFNGDVEMLSCPDILRGAEVEELLRGYENDFGKPLKRNRGTSDCPWKKKSIFFELPYWSNNMVRHNLDVMHIEKNICDKILGTLLNIGGKTKDNLNARQDLEEMGIKKDLHPVKCDDKHVQISASSFDMIKKEKEIFCSVLMNAKLPYGSASNISRCVQMKERKISGYKSHDAHFILQFLL